VTRHWLTTDCHQHRVQGPSLGPCYEKLTASEGAGDSRIRLDAHRLVLCLTKGAPPKPTAVAKHAGGCRDPGCINPAHLAWGTQKENVREGYIDLRSRRVRQKGVVAPLVLCGVEPGRRRVIFRSFHACWRLGRRAARALAAGRAFAAVGRSGDIVSGPPAAAVASL